MRKREIFQFGELSRLEVEDLVVKFKNKVLNCINHQGDIYKLMGAQCQVLLYSGDINKE